MHRLRNLGNAPQRPSPAMRPCYRRAATLMLMATLAGVALPAGAQDAPAPSGGLPLQPATLADDAAPAGTPPADEMATVVATLQKQIIAQQALLQVLQARLAAGSEPPSGGAGGASTAAVAPASPAASSPTPPHVPPSTSTAGTEASSVSSRPLSPADAGQTPAGAGGATVPAPEGASVQSGTSAMPSASPDGRRETPPVTPQTAETASGGAGSAPTQAPADTRTDMPLQTDAQRQAYASGASVWREIKSSITSQHALGIDLDERYVMAGLQDMALNRPLKMSADEMDRTMSALNTDYIRRANEARLHQEAEGKAYRIAFSKQKGAYSDAGAWYRVDDRGQGRHLRTTDMAVLQVTGTLPDGTVFDASGQQGRTRTVKVGSLLPSVAIGLQKVAPGGKLTVVVPPQKGYGDAGLPPTIPGGATLIFDITVKGVTKGE